MPRSKSTRKSKPKKSLRNKRIPSWKVVPHISIDNNNSYLIFPDAYSAANYCMEKAIPYFFEEDISNQTETIVWIARRLDKEVSMTFMLLKDFMSMYVTNPFICYQCGSSHLLKEFYARE